jgi:hypothetical protein
MVSGIGFEVLAFLICGGAPPQPRTYADASTTAPLSRGSGMAAGAPAATDSGQNFIRAETSAGGERHAVSGVIIREG